MNSSKLKIIVMEFILSLALVALSLYAFLNNEPGTALGVEIKESLSGIRINPQYSFLNLSNMAPGDKDSAPLTVSNVGKAELQCNVTASVNGGDTLYNALNMRIEDENGESLFDGKLKDLSKIMLGTFKSGSDRKFIFTVEFPKEYGNEYQGLTTAATFTINASGTDDKDTNNESNNDLLMPRTGVSSTSTYYLVGAAAVIAGFLLIKRRKP